MPCTSGRKNQKTCKRSSICRGGANTNLFIPHSLTLDIYILVGIMSEAIHLLQVCLYRTQFLRGFQEINVQFLMSPFTFSIFSSLTIIWNFVLMSTWVPAWLILHHKILVIKLSTKLPNIPKSLGNNFVFFPSQME